MTKQMIVMRKDLNMRKGKMIAQGAHSSVAVLLNQGNIFHPVSITPWGGTEVRESQFILDLTPALKEWITGLFTKICVSVDSEEELMAVYNKAKDSGLLCALITDCGLTEFNGVPTKTCCAIGPASDEELQPITGHLKLL
jgi:PTH2 family peptidyl-tRNA hydrolase